MAGEEEMMAFICRVPSTMMQSVQSLLELLIAATRTTGTIVEGGGKVVGGVAKAGTKVGSAVGTRVGNVMTGHGNDGIVSIKRFQNTSGDGETTLRQLGFDESCIMSHGHNRHGDPDLKRLNQILRRNHCKAAVVREADGKVTFLLLAKDAAAFDASMEQCIKEFHLSEDIASGKPIPKKEGRYPDTFSYGGNEYALDKVATDDAGGVRTWRTEGKIGGIDATLYVWEEDRLGAGNKTGGYRLVVDGEEVKAGGGIRCANSPDQTIESAIVMARSEASTLDVTPEQIEQTRAEIAAQGKAQPHVERSASQNGEKRPSPDVQVAQGEQKGLEARTNVKDASKPESPEVRRAKATEISNASATKKSQKQKRKAPKTPSAKH